MRAWAVLVGTLLLAGCVGPSADGDAPGTDEEDGGRTARPGDRTDGESEDLTPSKVGRQVGGQTMAGRIAFTVTVPTGGARDVEWLLMVTPIAAGLDAIEGPGCSSSGGVTWAVGSYTATQGSCTDLAEGEHAFEIVLTQPVLSYDGSVTAFLVPEGKGDADSSSNATER